MIKEFVSSLSVVLKYTFGRGTEQRLPAVAPECRKTAVVNVEKCCACGLCDRVCPVGAVNVRVERNKGEWRPVSLKIDADKCVACGLCADVCPCSAVVLEKDEADVVV